MKLVPKVNSRLLDEASLGIVVLLADGTRALGYAGSLVGNTRASVNAGIQHKVFHLNIETVSTRWLRSSRRKREG